MGAGPRRRPPPGGAPHVGPAHVPRRNLGTPYAWYRSGVTHFNSDTAFRTGPLLSPPCHATFALSSKMEGGPEAYGGSILGRISDIQGHPVRPWPAPCIPAYLADWVVDTSAHSSSLPVVGAKTT